MVSGTVFPTHIAHGFFYKGIISADDRLCRKAKAIYEYYGKTNNVGSVASIEVKLLIS